MANWVEILGALGDAVSSVDFWSVYQEEVQLDAAATDLALPDVVVAGLPAGAHIIRAMAFFKARMAENTNAAVNGLDGAQNIKVQKGGAGGYSTGIALTSAIVALAATTREPGDVFMGGVDISALVTGNDTYNFQWTQALALQADLLFNDVQTGLRLWYSV
jgi:hypothetical protein